MGPEGAVVVVVVAVTPVVEIGAAVVVVAFTPEEDDTVIFDISFVKSFNGVDAFALAFDAQVATLAVVGETC